MDSVFALLGAAGVWLLWELLGEVVGEILRPVLSPIAHLLVRLISGWAVALLWICAVLSVVLWRSSLSSPSTAIRVAGLLLFLGAIPTAVMVTFEWRSRRAVAFGTGERPY